MKNIVTLLATMIMIGLAQYVSAEPKLHGMGVHKELGRNVFIGALYSDVKTKNATDLLRSVNPLKMEIKITAKSGVSKRSFRRMWIEGVAINSDAASMTNSADDLFAFTKLFNQKLTVGDNLVIRMNRPSKPEVILNNTKLGELGTEKLFFLLLSTWIGEVPLSSDFRASLLNHMSIDKRLLAKFNSTKPSAARIAAIKNSSGQIEDVAKLSTAEAPIVKKKDAKKKTTAKKPATKKKLAKKSVAKKPLVKKSTKKVAKKVVKKTVAKKPVVKKPVVKKKVVKKKVVKKPVVKKAVAKKAIVKKPVKKVAKKTEKKTAAKRDTAKKIAKVASPAKTRVRPKKREPEGDLTVESLLQGQFYFTKLDKIIKGNIRYPQQAKQRGQEGIVRVAVILDRNGKLLRAEPLVESRYKLLNIEAVNAIKRASPYPPVPVVMRGNRHEFSVPVIFDIK